MPIPLRWSRIKLGDTTFCIADCPIGSLRVRVDGRLLQAPVAWLDVRKSADADYTPVMSVPFPPGGEAAARAGLRGYAEQVYSSPVTGTAGEAAPGTRDEHGDGFNPPPGPRYPVTSNTADALNDGITAAPLGDVGGPPQVPRIERAPDTSGKGN